jgi:hypothetical protein
VIENDILVDVIDHKLIRNFSESSSIEIPFDIEILGTGSFSGCESISSLSFESNSRLTKIESDTFSMSSLQSIVVPSGVTILCPDCFAACDSLSSVSFESNSRLIRIELHAFSFTSLQSIRIPPLVDFIDTFDVMFG